MEVEGLIGEIQVLMQLKENRFCTSWLRSDDNEQWEHFGYTGRWLFDGNALEVRVLPDGDRNLGDVIETLFAGDNRDRLIVVNADRNQLVTRMPDSRETLEWTRVPNDSVPQTGD